MNLLVMQDHEEILVACRRFDREAPGQIGGSPLGSVEGEGVTVGRGSRGSVETGAKAGMRDRSGGVLFLPLSFLVFLVLGAGDSDEEEEDSERREEAARQKGGGILLVEATPCRSWSR